MLSGWQQALTRHFVGGDPGFRLEVWLSSESEQLRLRLRKGQLQLIDVAGVEFPSGEQPDLRLRFEGLSLSEVLLGTADTCEAFQDAEVAVDGRWCRALPATEGNLPHTGDFERIPGASLSVAILMTSTMFGDVGVCESWRDGALVSSELIPVSQLEESKADIRLTCTVAQLAAMRRREVSPLDALAGGVGILGEWPQLMCFAELVQHPSYLPLWSSDSTVAGQVAWGTVVSSAAYREAVQGARAQLGAMVG